MDNTLLIFVVLYIFSIVNAQILISNSNSIGGEKSGATKQNVKSSEDFLSDDIDNPPASVLKFFNRFRRDNPVLHYDNPIPAAPPATELDYYDNSINTVVNEPTSSIFTSTPTTNPSEPIIENQPLRDLSPVVNVQNPFHSPKNDPYEKSAVKFTFVTPGSSYFHLRHGRRPCQHNSDCYEMREPDEWCPSVAHPDEFFERGCFCEHSLSFCIVERRNGNIYEHTDCYPKRYSKCEI